MAPSMLSRIGVSVHLCDCPPLLSLPAGYLIKPVDCVTTSLFIISEIGGGKEREREWGEGERERERECEKEFTI